MTGGRETFSLVTHKLYSLSCRREGELQGEVRYGSSLATAWVALAALSHSSNLELFASGDRRWNIYSGKVAEKKMS
jgi:hypothetical protein